MKRLNRISLFVLLMVIIAITYTIAPRRIQHSSSEIINPLTASLHKAIYTPDDPVVVSVRIVNPFHDPIIYYRSDVRLSNECDQCGFHVSNGTIRPDYDPDNYMICGVDRMRLNAGQGRNEAIMIISTGGELPRGSHSICYKLQIPYYRNDKHLCVQHVSIDLNPSPIRRMFDHFTRTLDDMKKGNGSFHTQGTLNFVVE